MVAPNHPDYDDRKDERDKACVFNEKVADQVWLGEAVENAADDNFERLRNALIADNEEAMGRALVQIVLDAL